MTSLKRNMITLVKNPDAVNKGEEPEFEKVWTVPFISFGTSREAASLINQLYADEDMSDDEKNDKLADFMAEKAYGGKITKDDIFNRLPGPGFNGGASAQQMLEEQLLFVANGQQTDETKNFLAGKK